MIRGKTGIMTLSSANNYGAVLGSHSLCKYLNEYYSDSEIIDYTPQFIIDAHSSSISLNRTSLVDLCKSVIGVALNYPFKRLRIFRFNRFRHHYLKYSQRKFNAGMNNDVYDWYIVGGDQVFNLTLTQNDDTFFLPEIKRNKSTYAASLGLSALNDDQKESLSKGLEGFDHISIREKTGCTLISNIVTNKEIIRLIDPVFLYDKEYWRSVSAKNRRRGNYILIYVFSNYELAKSIADRIRKTHKCLNIIIITDFWGHMEAGVRRVRGVGPRQFLTLVENANLVVTDSFHGTAFSIIFETDFYVIPYKGTESRVIDMLDIFGMKSRIVYSADNICNGRVDFSGVESILQSERIKTKEYFDIVYEKQ